MLLLLQYDTSRRLMRKKVLVRMEEGIVERGVELGDVCQRDTTKFTEGLEAVFEILNVQQLDGTMTLGLSEGTDHAANMVIASDFNRSCNWWWEQYSAHLLKVNTRHCSQPVLTNIQVTEDGKDIMLQTLSHANRIGTWAGHEMVNCHCCSTNDTLMLLDWCRAISHWEAMKVDGVGRNMDKGLLFDERAMPQHNSSHVHRANMGELT